MSVHPRDLKPVTVYLPEDVIVALEAEAKLEVGTVSAVSRRVLAAHARAWVLSRSSAR